MLKKNYLPMAVLTVLGLTSVATAAQRTADQRSTMRESRRDGRMQDGRRVDSCEPYTTTYVDNACCPPPEPPAPCYPDECIECPRCLGPENCAGNPPVCPRQCGGSWGFTIAGFYWNAHQDGLEFAIENEVVTPDLAGSPVLANDATIGQLNNLVDAKYENPHFDWDFGFKLGFTYCSPCDGWDLGILWTWFENKASKHVGSHCEGGTTILPLWSAFTPAQGNILYASDAKDHWKLKLNLVDLELGRQFWTSKYLSIRPFIGLRYASLDQHNHITYRGGSWGARIVTPLQDAFNGNVHLKNEFRGLGVRSGLDTVWNFGCGFALYGDLAASIVYGRFSVDHEEFIRQATGLHISLPVLNADESFHACRGMLDLGLGIQWSTMFCCCKYGFTAMFGWEGHLFFNQNQMWRVNRVGAVPNVASVNGSALPNNSGQNVFHQRRGDLDTQGWTLTFKFDF